MPILVLHTYGILDHPDDHPASQEFWAAVPDVQASREGAEGILRGDTTPFKHDGTPYKQMTEFGVPEKPHFHDSSLERTGLATLSAWTDPESAAGYSYHGAHGGAMKHRNEWFRQDHTWPTLVLWWTSDIQSITWKVANAKLAHLNDHGSSRDAFSFKSMFTSTGENVRLDNQKVKGIGQRAK